MLSSQDENQPLPRALKECFGVRVNYYRGDGAANIAEAILVLAKEVKEAGEAITDAISQHKV